MCPTLDRTTDPEDDADAGRDPDPEAALGACACAPAIVDALADPLRRGVLETLIDRSGPVSLAALGRVAADASRRAEGPDLRTDWARIALRHTHLPVLEAAGLVSAARPVAAVTLRDHPALREGPLSRALLRSVDQSVWVALETVHADARRVSLLAGLADADGRASVERLVGRVIDAVSAGSDRAVNAATVAAGVRSVHLPALVECGLVALDTGSVVFDAHPWFSLEDLLRTLPD
jgi:DNA-binding transcriptional ArsR family regulator